MEALILHSRHVRNSPKKQNRIKDNNVTYYIHTISMLRDRAIQDPITGTFQYPGICQFSGMTRHAPTLNILVRGRGLACQT